jgi:hypothetical protein
LAGNNFAADGETSAAMMRADAVLHLCQMLHIREYFLLPELPGNALPFPVQSIALIGLRQRLSEVKRGDWTRGAQSEFQRYNKKMVGRKLPTLTDYIKATSSPDEIRS